MRIVAVDPSLRATGVALASDGALVTDVIRPTPLPKKRAPQTEEEQADRLLELDDLVWLWSRGADLLVVEAASKSSIGGLSEERIGLRTLITTRARRNGIRFVTISPSTVKVYACNNGHAIKEDMINAANKYFPQLEIDDDNEADALWMAALVARRYGVTIDNVPAAHERAFDNLKKVHWPEIGKAA